MRNEDDVGGRARVTWDEERVLRGGWTEIRLWRYGGCVLVGTLYLWISDDTFFVRYVIGCMFLCRWIFRGPKIMRMRPDLAENCLTTLTAWEASGCWCYRRSWGSMTWMYNTDLHRMFVPSVRVPVILLWIIVRERRHGIWDSAHPRRHRRRRRSSLAEGRGHRLREQRYAWHAMRCIQSPWKQHSRRSRRILDGSCRRWSPVQVCQRRTGKSTCRRRLHYSRTWVTTPFYLSLCFLFSFKLLALHYDNSRLSSLNSSQI